MGAKSVVFRRLRSLPEGIGGILVMIGCFWELWELWESKEPGNPGGKLSFCDILRY
jgi:hypothetical protein